MIDVDMEILPSAEKEEENTMLLLKLQTAIFQSNGVAMHQNPVKNEFEAQKYWQKLNSSTEIEFAKENIVLTSKIKQEITSFAYW
jgi:hypothetical protein